MEFRIRIMNKEDIKKEWQETMGIGSPFYAGGYYCPRTQTITISNDLNLQGKVAVIAHEVLHALGVSGETGVHYFLGAKVAPLFTGFTYPDGYFKEG